MWARRKAAVLAEAEADERAQVAVVVAEERAALEEKTDAEILAELDLQEPDEMGLGDDFSGFMKAAVPERIRRRALRKLWLSNPVLAHVDNLVDYGDDFTLATSALETVQTVYQVGKGMLAHVEEMAKQQEAADEADEDVPDAPQEQTVGEMLAEDQGNGLEVELDSEPDQAAQQEAPPIGVKRRMRFAFTN